MPKCQKAGLSFARLSSSDHVDRGADKRAVEPPGAAQDEHHHHFRGVVEIEHAERGIRGGLRKQRTGRAGNGGSKGVGATRRQYTGEPIACMRRTFSRMPVSAWPKGE